MGPAAAGHQGVLKVERQGVLLFNDFQQFGCGPAFFQTGQLLFAHDRVAGQLFGHCRSKALLQPDEVKNVANIHKPDELVFGHDFAKFTVALRLTQIVDPGGRGLLHLVEAHAAHIGLVGGVGSGLFPGLRVLGQFSQKFRIGLGTAFLGGGAAIVQGQFRREVQAVCGCLDANSCHGAILLRP